MKELKCEKHPKFKGRKKPKYECTTCLNIYLKLKNKPRILPKPTRIEKDKSKYNRKDKHKKKLD